MIPSNLGEMSEGEGKMKSVSAINKICYIKPGLKTKEWSGVEAAF